MIANDNSIVFISSSPYHDNFSASDNDKSSNKQGIDEDEINVCEVFAGETLCTIL